MLQMCTREKPRRHFTWNAFPRQYSSAGSIFELAELHGHPPNQTSRLALKRVILRTIRKIYSAENMLREQSEQAIFFNIPILLLYLQFQLAYLICIVMRNNKALEGKRIAYIYY